MPEEIIEKKSNFDLTSRSTFSRDEEVFTSRSYAALLATNAEKAILAKYDFNTLEFTTVKQMYEELALLQKWSVTGDEKLKADADLILEIRTKELKFIVANRYANISNEIYKGYLALENYFQEISKYND